MKKTMTSHNIRISGKDQKHNDRNFENNGKGHCDPTLESKNFYWNCYNEETFLEAEKRFYKEHFSKALEEQNERNKKNGHSERNKTIDDIRTGRHTAPMERVFEVGNSDDRTDGNETLDIYMETKRRLEEKYPNFKVIDYALHADEKGNDHIHERSVITYIDENGTEHIGQEKGLKQMGIPLPDPSKKESRTNNRRMTFDKIIREMTAEIAKELYDYDLEKSESPGGMRLEDYRSWKEAQRKVKEAEDRAQEAEERADIAEERKKDAEISEKIAKNNAVDWINTAEEAKKLTDEEIAKKNKKKMQKEKIENDIAELSEIVDELQKKYYEFSHLIGERERNDIEKQIEDLRQGIERT